MFTFDVHYEPRRIQFLEILQDPAVRALLRDHGVSFNFRDVSPVRDGADGYILQRPWLTHEVLDSGKPIIYAERRDSSVLYWREMIDHPNLRAVWKLSRGSLRSQNECAERYHSEILAGRVTRHMRPLTHAEYRKIHVVPHYGLFPRMRSWITPSMPSDSRRKTSALFRGKLSYPRAADIAEHRQACVAALASIPGAIGTGERLHGREYRREMLGARAVVSPWGYGEVCWRDVEAIYAGCVLIKPKSDYVATEPLLYAAGATYLLCRPDWSDLAHVVENVTRGWDSLEPMRRANFSRLLEAWRPEALVGQFLPALRACM